MPDTQYIVHFVKFFTNFTNKLRKVHSRYTMSKIWPIKNKIIKNIFFQMACVMVGNPSLCLDAYEHNTFQFISAAQIKIVIVDLQYLRSDLDLTVYPSVKVVITHGTSSHTVKTNAKVIVATELLSHKPQSEAVRHVHTFEETTNKQSILTYGFTSGSTGPPKLVVYKNALPMVLNKFENDLDPSLFTLYRLVKKCGFTETIQFLKSMKSQQVIGHALNFNGFIVNMMIVTTNLIPGKKSNILLDMNNIINWPSILSETRVNVMIAYNPRMYELLSVDTFDKFDLSQIKCLAVGGSFMSQGMYQNIKRRFGKHTKSSNFPIINK